MGLDAKHLGKDSTFNNSLGSGSGDIYYQKQSFISHNDKALVFALTHTQGGSPKQQLESQGSFELSRQTSN
jgi:hypothetical protein